MTPLSVLIIDDSSLMRQRLRLIIDRCEGLHVSGEAVSGEEGLEQHEKLKPDVVTVDLSLPGMSGIEVVEALGQRTPAPLMVVITNYPYPELRKRSQELGVAVFLSKSDSPERIRSSILALGNQVAAE